MLTVFLCRLLITCSKLTNNIWSLPSLLPWITVGVTWWHSCFLLFYYWLFTNCFCTMSV